MFFRIFSFSLILIASLFISNHAAACSVSYIENELISEYVAKSDFVFEGKVEYINSRNVEKKYLNRVAHFNVSKTFHSSDSSLPRELDIYYQEGYYDCGFYDTQLETGKIYTVFARVNQLKELEVTLHSGEFQDSLIVYDPVQMANYFENGVDSHLFGHRCLRSISQIYIFKPEAFTEGYNLDNERCMGAKPYYDRMFRKADETKTSQ